MEKEAEKGVKLMTLYHTTDTDKVNLTLLTEKTVQQLDMTVTIYSRDARRKIETHNNSSPIWNYNRKLGDGRTSNLEYTQKKN